MYGYLLKLLISQMMMCLSPQFKQIVLKMNICQIQSAVNIYYIKNVDFVFQDVIFSFHLSNPKLLCWFSVGSGCCCNHRPNIIKTSDPTRLPAHVAVGGNKVLARE